MRIVTVGISGGGSLTLRFGGNDQRECVKGYGQELQSHDTVPSVFLFPGGGCWWGVHTPAVSTTSSTRNGIHMARSQSSCFSPWSSSTTSATCGLASSTENPAEYPAGESASWISLVASLSLQPDQRET